MSGQVPSTQTINELDWVTGTRGVGPRLPLPFRLAMFAIGRAGDGIAGFECRARDKPPALRSTSLGELGSHPPTTSVT